MIYDTIIVGAGHAGFEAAMILAKLNKKVLLVTISIDNVGKMSCNPAIGGLAKGHLVREIDALGGKMAEVIDKTGIQFRMLNRSKGPAVWGPRAQADRSLYAGEVRRLIESHPNIHLCEGSASGLIIQASGSKKCATGISLETGARFYSGNVVLCCGTFLKGVVHIGDFQKSSGRAWEPSSDCLSGSLNDLGFELRRFKTGTPARVNSDSVDFSKMLVQNGDDITHFSFRYKHHVRNKIKCYMTYTNDRTIEIIRNNIEKSALYSGNISGTGPRYCPSIEDKVVRFSENKRHQVFLEPDGLQTNELYCNGISTSLPYDVQVQYIRSIEGLEDCEITRPGYAIEYDCIDPTTLQPTLEHKEIKGLYFAGQINGTSGYEEAAAQGLMAGINIANKVDGRDEFILKRNEAYIGVLIDDLVTKGTNEPYRLFTSRAEHRLLLRYDNAYERLLSHSKHLGLLDQYTINHFENFFTKKSFVLNYLSSKRVRQGDTHKTLEKVLRQPSVSLSDLANMDNNLDISTFDFDERINIEVEVKYAGYLAKQEDDIREFLANENMNISNINFNTVPNLTTEAREKLVKIAPRTVGQASRISGVSPSDIINLIVHLKILQKRKK